MAGKEDRGPGLVELNEQVPDVADTPRVEAIGRFVENEKPRCADQSGGQAEALPHAEGVGADGPTVDAREADTLERRADAPASRPPVPAGSRGVKQCQVGTSGHVRIGGRLLDQRPDLGKHAPSVLWHSQAHDLYLALRRIDEAEQHPDQRRLA